MSESILCSFHLAELSSPLSHPAWPGASAPTAQNRGKAPELLPAGRWSCTVLLGVWEHVQEQSPSNTSLVLAEVKTSCLPSMEHRYQSSPYKGAIFSSIGCVMPLIPHADMET